MGNYEIPVDLDYKNPFHHARSLSLGASDQGYGYGNKESSSLFFKEWVQVSGSVSLWEAKHRLSVLMRGGLRDLQPGLYFAAEETKAAVVQGPVSLSPSSKVFTLLNSSF